MAIRSAEVPLSAIVEHLEGYTVTSENPGVRGVTVTDRHETGAELVLGRSGDGPKRRIIVSGQFPRSPYGETRAVEQVTMRASLPPAGAAAQITRRFPAYYDKHTAWTARNDEILDQKLRGIRIANELCEQIPGLKRVNDGQMLFRADLFEHHYGDLCVRIEKTTGLARFSVSDVPADLAAELASVYTRYLDKQPA